MEIRKAKINDAKAIASLINEYAEKDRMLFRSLADIYDNIQTFLVAEQAGQIMGCAALQVIWEDLAEIKSLAIAISSKGKGIGKALVMKALDDGRELGIKKIFALTMEPAFFERLGFSRIEMDQLPMKVWSDCARCPKQDNCDEIALISEI